MQKFKVKVTSSVTCLLEQQTQSLTINQNIRSLQWKRKPQSFAVLPHKNESSNTNVNKLYCSCCCHHTWHTTVAVYILCIIKVSWVLWCGHGLCRQPFNYTASQIVITKAFKKERTMCIIFTSAVLSRDTARNNINPQCYWTKFSKSCVTWIITGSTHLYYCRYP